jgi:hypothetical protein
MTLPYTPDQAAEQLRFVLEDAIRRFHEDNPDIRYPPDEVSYECWPQTWANTACGFGGLAGQALTAAMTYVVSSEWTGLHLVYFGAGFAYQVRRPNDRFFAEVHRHQLVPVYLAAGGRVYERPEPGEEG